MHFLSTSDGTGSFILKLNSSSNEIRLTGKHQKCLFISVALQRHWPHVAQYMCECVCVCVCVGHCDSVDLMDPCMNSDGAECQSLMVAVTELINSLELNY